MPIKLFHIVVQSWRSDVGGRLWLVKSQEHLINSSYLKWMLKLAPAPFIILFFLTFVYAGQIFKHDLTPIVLWCQMVSYGWCAWLANLANLAGQVEFRIALCIWLLNTCCATCCGISVLLFSTSSTIKKNNVFFMHHCKMWKKKHHSICIFLCKITYIWVHIGTKKCS